MEDARGAGRGSYIWGRSVHNTRIERLWYDVTHGFGQKWKKFFTDLEVHHGLNPQVPAHIWLLHHLFLHHINADVQDWAQAWNSHHLSIRGERNRSPQPDDEHVEDPYTYGIDWDVANDSTFMNQLLDQNPQDWADRNPFAPGLDTLSHVPCDAPNCPFTPEEVLELDRRLATVVDVRSRSMHVRRLVWAAALGICNEIYS
ncbi:hypothetical protein B0H14DRAFT_3105081 [Mycena olivaceomarginata]|nr:hypothetical protein B0H14DRAFT_3105081 [Mycena olivaceomarginata]